MKLNWNFLGGGGQKPSTGGVWIFSGTAHYHTVVPSNTLGPPETL